MTKSPIEESVEDLCRVVSGCIGARLESVHRIFHTSNCEIQTELGGPVELILSNGETLRFEHDEAEERLAVQLGPWCDPYTVIRVEDWNQICRAGLPRRFDVSGQVRYGPLLGTVFSEATPIIGTFGNVELLLGCRLGFEGALMDVYAAADGCRVNAPADDELFRRFDYRLSDDSC